MGDEALMGLLAEAIEDSLSNEHGTFIDDATPTGLAFLVSRGLAPLVAAQVEAAVSVVRAEVAANLAAIERVYEVQCPVSSTEDYMDAGAYYAHLWWQTVLGGEIDRQRSALLASPSDGTGEDAATPSQLQGCAKFGVRRAPVTP